jgi:hypothetical protein
VSAIGDFLREIMPSWLNRPGREHVDASRRGVRRSGRFGPGEDADDARVLAREADDVWQQCVDKGLHGEAFPEPIADKPGRAAKPAATEKKPTKPAGSNGPH